MLESFCTSDVVEKVSQICELCIISAGLRLSSASETGCAVRGVGQRGIAGDEEQKKLHVDRRAYSTREGGKLHEYRRPTSHQRDPIHGLSNQQRFRYPTSHRTSQRAMGATRRRRREYLPVCLPHRHRPLYSALSPSRLVLKLFSSFSSCFMLCTLI